VSSFPVVHIGCPLSVVRCALYIATESLNQPARFHLATLPADREVGSKNLVDLGPFCGYWSEIQDGGKMEFEFFLRPEFQLL
jgi:hypothetical protein